MRRWLRFLPVVAFPLGVAGIMASTPMAQTVDVVETSGIVASYDEGHISSAVSASVEKTLGAGRSGRMWGCVMVKTQSATQPGRIDRGCGPLTVTTDVGTGAAQVSGVVPSEVFDENGRSLGASSISVNATSTEAGPAPSPCAGHSVLVDPVRQVEIKAGVIRQATIGWELVSEALGTHTVGKGRGHREFFIHESGVIRPSTTAPATCHDPIGG